MLPWAVPAVLPARRQHQTPPMGLSRQQPPAQLAFRDSSLANVSDCNCMRNPQKNCVLEPFPNLWPTKSQEKIKPLFEVAESVGPSIQSRSDSTVYILNRIRQRRTAGASSGRRGLQSHEKRGPGDTQLPGSLLKRLGNLGERK